MVYVTLECITYVHSYRPLPMKGCRLDSPFVGQLWPLSREGFLSCLICGFTRPRFWRSLLKGRPMSSPFASNQGVYWVSIQTRVLTLNISEWMGACCFTIIIVLSYGFYHPQSSNVDRFSKSLAFACTCTTESTFRNWK